MLNRKLDDLLPSFMTKNKNAIIGIELEIENAKRNNVDCSKYWNFIGEDSLRNGIEAVSYPLTRDSIEPAIEMLYLKFKSFSTSYRTSTHFHYNMVNYTEEQILQFVFVHYLLEEILIELQSPNRKNNLFCTNMKSCEGHLYNIMSALDNPNWKFPKNLNESKYSALNLVPLSSLGTVEWRFMDAFKTSKEMNRWVWFMHFLVQFSVKTPIDRIMEMAHSNTLIQNLPFGCKTYLSGYENRLSNKRLLSRLQTKITTIKSSSSTNNYYFKEEDL